MAPLQAFIAHTIVDSEGRPLATIGSVEEDLEGRIVRQISQELQFEIPFLRAILEEMQKAKSLTVESTLDHVFVAPVFRETRRSLIERGLAAYWGNESHVAVHLLIPQIEAALQDLLGRLGGHIYHPKRGGLLLKGMDEILREKPIRDAVTEEVSTYFRVLFTDPRGWNLRNNVMHGLVDRNQFGFAMADRVLHALLVLAMLREKKVD